MKPQVKNNPGPLTPRKIPSKTIASSSSSSFPSSPEKSSSKPTISANAFVLLRRRRSLHFAAVQVISVHYSISASTSTLPNNSLFLAEAIRSVLQALSEAYSILESELTFLPDDADAGSRPPYTLLSKSSQVLIHDREFNCWQILHLFGGIWLDNKRAVYVSLLELICGVLVVTHKLHQVRMDTFHQG
ncbi:uncharacterized protein LOC131168778 isoform X2 [Hevea brasiliensis]|uniref:uncharacterized protein LOC131168778 isoform X2 n=1 Tax=Hevea brasiliensis TaxID=3981 RepID=UPI0025D989EA|nr:uncharacterized protein LOC131168778 isoform X2 [Hevea brasiliensis]